MSLSKQEIGAIGVWWGTRDSNSQGVLIKSPDPSAANEVPSPALLGPCTANHSPIARHIGRSARSSVHDSTASARRSPVPSPRYTGRECGPRHRGARHPRPAPRSSVLGPRSCCAALQRYRGAVRSRRCRLVCRQQAQMKKRPTEFGDPTRWVLAYSKAPKKGGVGVRLATFSRGWKGSSYPRCVVGVVANLG